MLSPSKTTLTYRLPTIPTALLVLVLGGFPNLVHVAPAAAAEPQACCWR